MSSQIVPPNPSSSPSSAILTTESRSSPITSSLPSSTATETANNIPNEIPPDHGDKSAACENDSNSHPCNSDSEYEYDYEDEEECHLSSFLIQDPRMSESASSSAAVASSSTSTTPATIPQDVPTEIPADSSSTSAASAMTSEKDRKKRPAPSSPSHSSSKEEKKTTWREPTKEAVSMSLRAEKETSGGKRRLASDLYKVMMGDTAEQGFSMEPSSEDSMSKWKIKLFKFDEDSNLHKDLMYLGLDHVELEMSFPEQYPFEPPFVRVVRPRFRRQTGFVMNGALCMELLTSEGWNPVNDIESVIVSVRSLLVVGDGRLAAVPEKSDEEPDAKRRKDDRKPVAGAYSVSEARAAYSHLTDYHRKKGWDSSGWWARKG